MKNFNRKKHWEHIYNTKNPEEVSWFQPIPETSLEFIDLLKMPKTAKIIDIGGGESFLAEHLLKLGYQDLTVLDISEAAIERAKHRLREKSEKIKWIVSDITAFQPTEKYDLWHDRATFHFLTGEPDISKYLSTAHQSIQPNGNLLIGTFSEQGPKKCSGIEIKQYSEKTLNHRFEQYFKKTNCVTVDHKTPFGTTQNFIFCNFQRLALTE